MSTQLQGLLKRLDEIVDGIDRDESDGGWWETEKGVELGKTTLRELRQLVTEAAQSTQPAPPVDGEAAKLAETLKGIAYWKRHGRPGDPGPAPFDIRQADRLDRAAELLQRQALVPEAVSDALIKAECALADIAEGEPMTDEGDPLQWAERRCADTLAIIRPTMRQHKIPTSEWPPVPAHALPLPEVGK